MAYAPMVPAEHFAEQSANGFERDELHAAQRFVERYGRALDSAEYDAHVSAIRDGRSTKRGHGYRGRELHAISEPGAPVILAVFCPHWGRIVTYLAREHEWRGKVYGRIRS